MNRERVVLGEFQRLCSEANQKQVLCEEGCETNREGTKMQHICHLFGHLRRCFRRIRASNKGHGMHLALWDKQTEGEVRWR